MRAVYAGFSFSITGSPSVRHLVCTELCPSDIKSMATINDGQYTKTVYSLIKDGRLSDAIGFLEPVLEVCIGEFNAITGRR